MNPRLGILLSLVVAACAPTSPDGVFDLDQITCTTEALTEGVSHVTWRGAITTSGPDVSVALTRGHVHPDTAIGDVEPGSVAIDVASGWTETGLAIADDAITVDLVWDDVEILSGQAQISGDDVLLVCWPGGHTLPHSYADGACTDHDGNVGRTEVSAAYVRETGNGQCADLGEQALDEGDLGYPEWVGFDLRGADLSSASLHFANIVEASLEGAQIEGLDFGYAEIGGTVDEHSTYPENCTVADGVVFCRQ